MPLPSNPHLLNSISQDHKIHQLGIFGIGSIIVIAVGAWKQRKF
ncbi:MAG: hypothetical protein ACTSRK_10395 [Promethearchaeota archaeon]